MGKRTNSTTPIKVYGYTVLYKKPDDAAWTVEPDDDIPVLPSHYDWPEQAADRVKFLREKGFLARSMALLAERADKGAFNEETSDE